MQLVAAEMNLAETAFVRPLADGHELRWFTPKVEVALCGHATLASAHALWTEGLVEPTQSIRFQTKSGVLTCTRRADFIEMDFPATPATPCAPPPGLLEALGVSASFVGETEFDHLVVAENESAVRALNPDMRKLRDVPTRGVIVTSRSGDRQFDFVSRFFAPAVGIDEDPVTGSAHCCLGPYWGTQLGKTDLRGFQASARGGSIRVTLQGGRVILGGQAVTVLRGELV
jgi:PhzF family phenazine biosynthesis protein